MKLFTLRPISRLALASSLILVTWLLPPASGVAQVGIGTTTPDASAQLELQTTTRGFLPPRMSALQMAAIASPAPGLVVYNTTANQLYYRDGGTNTWLPVGAGAVLGDDLGNHTATTNIRLNGNWLSNDGGSEGVFVTTDGNVGIGIAAPTSRFYVLGNSQFMSGGAGTPLALTLGRTAADLEMGVAGGFTDFSNFANIGDAVIRSNTSHLILTARNATGNIYFGSGSTDAQRMTMLNNGNFGIGTTTPGAQLHTTGTVRFGGLGTTGTLTGYQLAAVNTTTGQVERFTGTLPGDNLGNHTATANLNMGNNLIVGTNNTSGIQIDANGNVGINIAPNTANRLLVSQGTSISGDAAIRGENLVGGINPTYGIYGYTASNASLAAGVYGTTPNGGSGVYGENTSAANNSAGVRGVQSASTASTTYGVFGSTASTVGTSAGVFGTTATAGYGVIGRNTGTMNNSGGLLGQHTTSTGNVTYGVIGTTASTAATAAGVYGYSSTAGYGVHGYNDGSLSNTAGIFGYSNPIATPANQTFGVVGITNSTHSFAAGVYGESSTQAFGVYGRSTLNVANATGVRGIAAASGANATFGVYGSTLSNSANGAGVYGNGSINGAVGVRAESGGSGAALHAINTSTGLAALIDGPANFLDEVRTNGDPGVSGQVLTSAGAGAPPTWTNVSGADNWGSQVVQSSANFTGNGTSGNPLQLSNTGVTAGPYAPSGGGTSIDIPGFNVDAFGRITGASTTTINVGDDWGTQTAITSGVITGDGSGSAIRLTDGTAANQVPVWDGSAWSIAAAPGDGWGTDVATANGFLTGDGTSGDPLRFINGAGIGHVPTWNGTNWVSTAVPADNLGNHTAITNIQLGANWLSGDGGSEGVFVDANGNVGVGTSTPATDMHVLEPGAGFINANYTMMRVENLRRSAAMPVHKVGLEVISDGDWGNGFGTNTGLKVSVGIGLGGAETYAATFMGGNVGIGTTAPVAQLHTTGTARFTGLPTNNLFNDAVHDFLYINAAGDVERFTGTLPGDNLGNHTATAQIQSTAGTAAAPGYSFSGDLNTGIFSPSADELALSTAGTQRMVVDAGGNVGIGTATASNVLVNAEATGSRNTTFLANLNNNLSSPGNSYGFRALAFNTAAGVNIRGFDANVIQTVPNQFAVGIEVSGNVTGGGTGIAYGGAFQASSNATPGPIAIMGLVGGHGANTAVRAGRFVTSAGTAINAAGSSYALDAQNQTTGGQFAYGLSANVTSTATTNYGVYSSVSGATNNYSGIFMGGNFGIGTATPAAQLHTTGSVRFAGAPTTGTFTPATDDLLMVNAAGDVQRFTGTLPGDNLGNHLATTNLDMNGSRIRLAGIADDNHALRFAGTIPFNAVTIDGPMLYGFQGGALGSKNGGTEVFAMRWDVNGNVGIGTTTPGAKLHTVGVVRHVGLGTSGTLTGHNLAAINTTTGDVVEFTGTLPGDNLGNHTATQNLDLATFLLTGNGGTAGIAVANNGNVGIGATGASARLEIAAGAGADRGALFRRTGTTFTSPVLEVRQETNGDLGPVVQLQSQTTNNHLLRGLNPAGNQVFRVTAQGNIGIGQLGGTPTEALVVHNGNVLVSNDNNTAGRLILAEPSTSGTNFTAFQTAPQATDVVYTLPADDGTSGQVLQTDGSGILSWGTAPGDNLGNHIATAQIQSTLGTAAAPGYSFSGDLNTGVFSPGADILSIATAGTERVRVLANGNVGIGTTNAPELLTLNGNILFTAGAAVPKNISVQDNGGGSGRVLAITAGSSIAGGGSGGNLQLAAGSALGAGAGNGGNVLVYGGQPASGTVGNVVLAHNGSVSIGNVGIGTATPGAQLHTTGSVRFAGAPTSGTFTPATDDFLMVNAAGDVQRFTGTLPGDNLGNHTATANVIMGSNWLSGDGGNEGLRVDNVGRVGVNSAAPTEVLHVFNSANDVNAIAIEMTGTGSGAQAGLNVLTQGNGATRIGNAGTKGWSFWGRADGYVFPSEQNDLFISSHNGGTTVLAMHLDAPTGNVGIGVNGAATRLDVAGAVRVGTTADAASAANQGAIRYNGGSLQYSDGAAWQTVGLAGAGDNLGNHTATLQILGTAGTNAAPGYSFGGNTGTGMYAPAANQVALATNGLQRMMVDANGNVGIGIGATADVRVAASGSGAINTIYRANINGAVSAGSATYGYRTSGANTAAGVNITGYDANVQQSVANQTAIGIDISSSVTGGGTGFAYGGAFFASANSSSGPVGVYGSAGGNAANTSVKASRFLTIGGTAINAAGSSYAVEAQNQTTGGANAYGIHASATGTATNNYGVFATVSGGTNNYAGVFQGGNVGVGTTAPSQLVEANNGNVLISSTTVTPGELRLEEGTTTAGNHYTAFRAADQATNVTYTLPTGAAAANGYVLSSSTAGVMSWTDPTTLPSSGWALVGNAATNPATHFVGTTDAQPLRFKVNNTWAGTLDPSGITALGLRAGDNSTVVITALGRDALAANTTGPGNTAVGDSALLSNTTGIENTAFGYGSLQSNATASANTAVGVKVLASNTLGNFNTGMGHYALNANTDGSFNTAVGHVALRYNTSGENNHAFGVAALTNNLTGINNVAIGRDGLMSNTTGGNNTAVGHQAGNVITTGTNNTFIGSLTSANANNRVNSTAIGANARVDADNAVVIGSVNGINGAGATVNVGIGITAPLARLHTDGTVRMANLATTATLTGYQLAAVNTTTGAVERYTGALPGDNLGNHTATAQIQSTAGTAAAPGYSFVGDLNTGIYRSAADELSITTAGTQRMFVLADGKVQIGAPWLPTSNNLQVGGFNPTLGIIDGTLINTAGNALGTLNFGDGLVATPQAQIKAWRDAAAAAGDVPAALLFSTVADGTTVLTERMRIANSGNVGIGTTAPAAQLHTTGSARFAGLGTTGTFTDASDDFLMVNAAGDVQRYTGTLPGDNLGNHTANTQLQGIAGSNAAPSYSFIGDLNTGIYNSGADQVSVVTGGNIRVLVNEFGNVGIGTVGPTSRLQVETSSNATSGIINGSVFLAILNNTAASTAQVRASVSEMFLTGTASHAGGRAYGAYNSVQKVNNVTTGEAAGAYNIVTVGAAGGIVNAAYGSFNVVENQHATAGISIGIGTQGRGLNTGNAPMAALMGGQMGINNNGTGTVSNSYALSLEAPVNNGTITNYTSLMLAEITAAGIGTSRAIRYDHSTNPFVVMGNGNVGIGILNPTAQLHTTGTARFAGLATTGTFTAATDDILIVNAAGDVLRYTGTMPGDNLGNHTATLQIQSTLGTVAAPGYSFTGDLNTGIYSPGADLIGLAVAGSEAVRINTAGNVGIGTTTPGNKLVVATTSGHAVVGTQTSATGLVYGVYGTSASDQGTGVSGLASATTGTTFGVYGESASSTGYGVAGFATAVSASVGTGVYGESASDNGVGVSGNATDAFGVTVGVSGHSASTAGTGVFGQASSATGISYGVRGEANSSNLNSAAVYGRHFGSGWAGDFVGKLRASGSVSFTGLTTDATISAGDEFLIRSSTGVVSRYTGTMPGDNLGNHLMLTDLITDNNWISGDGDTEGLFVNFSGNVGIGTNAPQYQLQVNDMNNSASSMQLTAGTATGTAVGDGLLFKVTASEASISNHENTPLILATNSTARVNIDQNGLVGIGCAPALYGGGLSIELEESAGSIILNQTGNTYAPQFQMIRNLGTEATPLPVTSGSSLGSFAFLGRSTTNNFLAGAVIEAAAAENFTSTTASGTNMMFSTTPMGSSSVLERMRITAAGNVGIGTTGPGSKLSVSGGLAVGTTYAGFIAPANGAIFEGNVGIGVSGPGAQLHVQTAATTEVRAISTAANNVARFVARANALQLQLDADASSSQAILGTTTAHDMAFRTNATERMRIGTNGNVGIGSTTLSHLLNVEANDANTVGSYVARFDKMTTGTAAAGHGYGMLFRAENTGGTAVNAVGLMAGLSNVTPGGELGYFAITTNNAGAFGERVRVDHLGRVGLGTTTPAATLDVLGTVAMRRNPGTLAAGTYNALNLAGYSSVSFNANAAAGGIIINGIAAGVDGQIVIITNPAQATLNGMQINNLNAGAAANDQIITGTGAVLNSNAGQGCTIMLMYSTLVNKWIVINAQL